MTMTHPPKQSFLLLQVIASSILISLSGAKLAFFHAHFPHLEASVGNSRVFERKFKWSPTRYQSNENSSRWSISPISDGDESTSSLRLSRSNEDHINEQQVPNSGAMNFNYRSKSTFTPDASCTFHAGSEERKERLDQELSKIGVDLNFVDMAEYQGSAALRTYASFILPKSEGALAMTAQPRRSAVVANNIAFLLREHQSHQEEWLRNHDRSLEEIERTLFTNDQNGNGDRTLTRTRNPITLVLDNVRSAHNVGNIIRAAEAAMCTSVMLCGSMTPAPPHPKVLKTALGAAEYVPFEKIGSTWEAVQELKRQGVKVIGVETTSRSIPLWNCSFFERGSSTNCNGNGNENKNDEKVKNTNGSEKENENVRRVAFIFGNEMIGVDTQCLEECDELISLPTHGVKNSLNVATCASVVIWEALRQLDALDE